MNSVEWKSLRESRVGCIQETDLLPGFDSTASVGKDEAIPDKATVQNYKERDDALYEELLGFELVSNDDGIRKNQSLSSMELNRQLSLILEQPVSNKINSTDPALLLAAETIKFTDQKTTLKTRLRKLGEFFCNKKASGKGAMRVVSTEERSLRKQAQSLTRSMDSLNLQEKTSPSMAAYEGEKPEMAGDETVVPSPISPLLQIISVAEREPKPKRPADKGETCQVMGDLLNLAEPVSMPEFKLQPIITRDLSRELLRINSGLKLSGSVMNLACQEDREDDAFMLGQKKPSRDTLAMQTRSQDTLLVQNSSRDELMIQGSPRGDELRGQKPSSSRQCLFQNVLQLKPTTDFVVVSPSSSEKQASSPKSPAISVDPTEAPNDLFLQRVWKNYQQVMRRGRTAVPVSFAEVKSILLKYYIEIDVDRRGGDPKQLLLIPLNENCDSRWVPLGSKFRVGRNISWLRSKSLVISRNHAEIIHDIDNYYLVDVGSNSGTFLNGSRLSAGGQQSSPAALSSGDVIQFGVDCCKDDENTQLKYRCAQAIVVLGYPRKTIVRARIEAEEMMAPQHRDDGCGDRGDNQHSWREIEKLQRNLKRTPLRLRGSSLRVFFQFGDMISDTSMGMGVISLADGKREYTAIFNNYKMYWELAMTNRCGMNTLVLDMVAGSERVYKITMGLKELARVTVLSKDKIVIDTKDHKYSDPQFRAGKRNNDAIESSIPSATEEPLAPVYIISGNIHSHLLATISRRTYGDANSVILGEAICSLTKKSFWGSTGRLLEVRMGFPERHEQVLIMSILFAALLQL